MYNVFFYFDDNKNPKFGVREIERPPHAYGDNEYKTIKWLHTIGLSKEWLYSVVDKEVAIDNDYIFDSLIDTYRAAFSFIFEAKDVV